MLMNLFNVNEEYAKALDKLKKDMEKQLLYGYGSISPSSSVSTSPSYSPSPSNAPDDEQYYTDSTSGYTKKDIADQKVIDALKGLL